MAESTKEAAAVRPKPKTSAAAPASEKKATTRPAPAAETATNAAATPTRPSFWGILRGQGQGGQQNRSSMSRFFFGMSLYMVLALAAQFALAFVFARLPASYSTQALFVVPLLNLPITLYLLVWMVILVGILYALYKFGILPRNMGQPRTSAAATKTDPKAKGSSTAKVARTPVEGPDDDAYARVKARIRAERRKARRS